MEQNLSVVPVGVVRERVIQTLTNAFANDLISVTELEDRLEKAYRATTAEEAMALVAGLPTASPDASAIVASRDASAIPPHRERFLSILSSQARRGVWTVPREMHVTGVLSDTTIDLTNATLPSDIIDLRLRVVFANMTIVVPPGLRVVNRVGALMASVESDASLDLAEMKPGAPVVRISGHCVFGSLAIVSGPKLGDE
jgi:hypothetical protein